MLFDENIRYSVDIYAIPSASCPGRHRALSRHSAAALHTTEYRVHRRRCLPSSLALPPTSSLRFLHRLPRHVTENHRPPCAQEPQRVAEVIDRHSSHGIYAALPAFTERSRERQCCVLVMSRHHITTPARQQFAWHRTSQTRSLPLPPRAFAMPPCAASAVLSRARRRCMPRTPREYDR